MFVGIGMGVSAGRGGDDAGLSGADGLNFQRDRYRLNGVAYASLMAVPGATYSRTGAATAFRADGTLAEFAPNVPRITDRGVLIEGQATNLVRYSRQGWAVPGGSVAVPVANSNHVEDGRACMSGTFPEIANGDINKCEVLFGGGVRLQTDLIYSWAATIKLSRPLVDGESVWVWFAGHQDIGRVTITASSQQNGWSRIGATKTSAATGDNALYVIPKTLLSPLTVYCTDIQLEQASYTSSPIITTGAAATRGADNLALQGMEATFAKPFTVVGEASVSNVGGAQGHIAVGAATATTANRATVYTLSSTQALLLVSASNVTVSNPSVTFAASARRKFAMSFDGTVWRWAFNGISGAAVPMGSNLFASPLSVAYPFTAGNVDRLGGVGASTTILPYAASDAQLQAMTQ